MTYRLFYRQEEEEDMPIGNRRQVQDMGEVVDGAAAEFWRKLARDRRLSVWDGAECDAGGRY
jgi:hypothetical protein